MSRLDGSYEAMRNISARRTRARRARAVAAGLLLLPGPTGCYSNVPVWTGTPAAGRQVTVTLTDAGRTTLADELGPGARRLTGLLVSLEDSVYVVDVSAVEYVSGSDPTRWNGERIRVGRQYVGGVSERRLSRSRSWLMAGLAVATVALVSTIAITGYGSDEGSTRPKDDGGGQQQ